MWFFTLENFKIRKAWLHILSSFVVPSDHTTNCAMLDFVEILCFTKFDEELRENGEY
jgi:hypothetical protein